MFEAFAYDSYEAHVALRTVRTIDAIERISPLQRVAWKYDPDAPARRTEEAVKAQEERRLREAMEETMAPSEKAAAKAAAPKAARRAAGGRAGRRVAISQAGEMSAAMREREKERAQEEDDLRKTGLGGKQDLDRGRRASTMSKGLGASGPLPTSCRGRRTDEERRGGALVIYFRYLNVHLSEVPLISTHHQRMRMRSILPSVAPASLALSGTHSSSSNRS